MGGPCNYAIVYHLWLEIGPIKVPRPPPGRIFMKRTRGIRFWGSRGSGEPNWGILSWGGPVYARVYPEIWVNGVEGGRGLEREGESWVNYSIHGPPTPQLKIPQFGSQSPRDPKNQIPRVRFMKIRPGGRSGDLNRTDLRPYLGLAHVCSSLPSPIAPGFIEIHWNRTHF